jgi:hypothetical protein
VALTVPLLLQHRTIHRLTKENQELRTRVGELASMAEENSRLKQSGASPTLDGDRQSELLRLRGEAARARQLAQELDKLRTQRKAVDAEPAGNLASGNVAEWQPGEMKSKGDLVNAGFNDPRSTVETMLWSMATGNAENYLRALRPPPNEPMPTVEQLGQAVAAAKKDFATVIGIQLDSTEELTSHEVFVKITLVRSNSSQTPDSFVLEHVGTEWKIAGGPAPEGAASPAAPVAAQAAANP